MATFPKEPEVKIVECPRDAMQGILDFIPTETKIAYLNELLKVGFHTIDCGSFVSPKAIPQLRDTQELLNAIDLTQTDTKLSVIVANQRGVIDAVKFKQVDYLGFPFSVSETFQQRNTNKSIADSFDTVKFTLDQCNQADKEMVVYISMGFGNPYEDEWSTAIVTDWIGKLEEIGVVHFSLSDTVGVSTEKTISSLFSAMHKEFKEAEFGAHFHTTADAWKEKVDAAYANGCKRYDGAIKGYGGCPMAKDDLVGNMPTERLIDYFGADNLKLKKASFLEAFSTAENIFNRYL
jgi:hydroxymethylglutaryl-CoA lyase